MALVLMPTPPVVEATYPFMYNRIYYPIATPIWPVSIVLFLFQNDRLMRRKNVVFLDKPVAKKYSRYREQAKCFSIFIFFNYSDSFFFLLNRHFSRWRVPSKAAGYRLHSKEATGRSRRRNHTPWRNTPSITSGQL